MSITFKQSLCVLTLAGLAFGSQAGPVRHDDEDAVYKPTGRGQGELHEDQSTSHRAAAKAATVNPGNGILYRGGPVMNNANGTNVYFIWYGNWAGSTTPSILTDLVNNLTGSPWWNINTTYYDSTNKKVVNRVNYLGTTSDAYSQGKALSDAQIQTVVSSAITSGRLPKDTNGVYFVLTSSDVNATSGFCTQYCGWHTKGTIGGSTIKYSFVGNPDRCPTSCAAQTKGPNGNAGADAMASIVAHEFTETVSDPELNAWYDSKGAENADKCAWTFGTTYLTTNGAKANMKLGARDYLIQQNWKNAAGGGCVKAY